MDRPLDLSCRMPGAEPAGVKLFYRHGGQEHFTPVTMQRKGDVYRGRIPPQGVIGKALQHYIEAHDQAGKLLGSSGGAPHPHTVLIECPCIPGSERAPAPR